MGQQDEKQDKCDQANELLAAVDSSKMTTDQAEKVLADPNATQDQKDMADEVLSAADTYGLDERKAEETLSEDGGEPQGTG